MSGEDGKPFYIKTEDNQKTDSGINEDQRHE